MFADYTKLVLRSYEEKRKDNLLPLGLTHPTPAKLKEQCEIAFSTRYNRKDQRALNAFFGNVSEGEAGLKSIKRCETDKFKPLIKYLRQETQATEDKNIELLAWLIDFEPRPFEYGKRYAAEERLLVDDDCEKSQQQVDEQTQINQRDAADGSRRSPDTFTRINRDKNHFGLKAIIAIVIVLMLASTITYWSQKNKPETLGLTFLKSAEGCMYWVNDHYEQVSCSEKHDDTQVIALDTFKLKHFKKINNPDTITQNAIGSVWYIKINNQIQYFTSGGYYPLDPNRKLKPITLYMIKAHIRPDAK